MLTWILTSACVGTLSAAALELFREGDEPGCELHSVGDWERMDEADLDALVAEFSSESGEFTSHRLAA